jgi:predicted CXXCH cytochrome family protein
MAVQHDPFQFDECTGCHEPHASNYRPLVVRPQPELCYACHPQIRADFLKVSHHPVGTLLDCTGCHQPHASDYPALLPAKGNAICYTCHDVIRPQYVRSGHSRAYCWGCHQPHGSDFAPLLNNKQPDLCFPCHERRHYDDKKGGYLNHPVRPVYWDVNRRKPLTCTTSCHDPHGTVHNYMLRMYDSPLDGNCLICHAVVEGDKVGVDY